MKWEVPVPKIVEGFFRKNRLELTLGYLQHGAKEFVFYIQIEKAWALKGIFRK